MKQSRIVRNIIVFWSNGQRRTAGIITLSLAVVMTLFQNCGLLNRPNDQLASDTAEGLVQTSSRIDDLESTLMGLIDVERQERLAGELLLQSQITQLQKNFQDFEVRVDQRIQGLQSSAANFETEIRSEVYKKDEALRQSLQSEINSTRESLKLLIDSNSELDWATRIDQEKKLALLSSRFELMVIQHEAFQREVAMTYSTKIELAEVRQTAVELRSLIKSLDLKVNLTKDEILSTLGERVIEVGKRIDTIKSELEKNRADISQVNAKLDKSIDEYRLGMKELAEQFDKKLDLVEKRVAFIAHQENEVLRGELTLQIRQEAMILTLFLKQAVHEISNRIEQLDREIKVVERTDAARAEQLREDLLEARKSLASAIQEEHLKREELNGRLQSLASRVDLMSQDLIAQQNLISSMSRRLDSLTSDFEQEKVRVSQRFSVEREETNRLLAALEKNMEEKLQSVQRKAAELVAGLGQDFEARFKSVTTDVSLLNSRQASFESQLKGIVENVQTNRAKTFQFAASTSEIRQALLPSLVLSRQRIAELQIEFIKTLAPDEKRPEDYWASFKPLTVACNGDVDASFPNAMGMDVFQILSLEYINLLLSGTRTGGVEDEIFHAFGGGVDQPGFHRDLTMGIVQWPSGSTKAECVTRVRAWARNTLLKSASFSHFRRALAESSDLERLIVDSYASISSMGPSATKMSDLLKSSISDLPNSADLFSKLSAQYVVEWIDLADSEWALQDRVKDFEDTARFLEDQLENQNEMRRKIDDLRSEMNSFKAATDARIRNIENEVGSVKTSLKRALDVLISLSDRGGYADLKAATIWAGDPIQYTPQVIPDWRPQIRMVQHFFNGPLSLKNKTDACTGARTLEDGGVRGAQQFGSWGKCWVNFRSVPVNKWKSEVQTLWFRVFGAAEILDIWIDPDRQPEAKHLFKDYKYRRRIDFRNPPPDAKLSGRFDRGVFDFSALGMLDYYVERIRTWGGVTISFRSSRVQKFGDQEVVTSSPDFHYNIQLFSPLVVDFNKRGAIRLTSVNESQVWFALDPDVGPVRTGWVRRGDVGFLALDRNGNGTIDSGAELFGEGTRLFDGTRAKDGFGPLAEFDENQNGLIDPGDAIYQKLSVWRDYNEDGRSQESELVRLNSVGSPKFSLKVKKVPEKYRSNAGNLVDTFSDGDVRLYDVYFMSIK